MLPDEPHNGVGCRLIHHSAAFLPFEAVGAAEVALNCRQNCQTDMASVHRRHEMGKMELFDIAVVFVAVNDHHSVAKGIDCLALVFGQSCLIDLIDPAEKIGEVAGDLIEVVASRRVEQISPLALK